MTNIDLIKQVPVADSTSNKSNNGILSIIGGSKNIIGSPIFNTLAASVVGTSYIYLTITSDIFVPVSIHIPWALFNQEYTKKNEKAILIGSGCDNRIDFDNILKQVMDLELPIVLDGYGLKRYKALNIKNKKTLIMTPHIKEFSVLTGIDIEQIKENREEIANKYAIYNKCIVVLKDYKTYITDGNKSYYVSGLTASLAKAGSGDILAGFIAGLLARGLDPFVSCLVGASLLDEAGKRAIKNIGICSCTPLDIINESKKILFELKK